MRVLCIIPARSGSKGVKNKNIQTISGKTLIEIAIDTAKGCDQITDIYISTDSLLYQEIAIELGAKSIGLREKSLSNDEAKTKDVIIDLLGKLENNFDTVVLLQPTAPIRKSSDITNALKYLENPYINACVSVCKIDEPHPYKLKSIDPDGFIKSFMDGTSSEISRQALPTIYALNGAIYVCRVDALIKENTLLPSRTLPYIMKTNYNIDRYEDLVLIKALIQSGQLEYGS